MASLIDLNGRFLRLVNAEDLKNITIVDGESIIDSEPSDIEKQFIDLYWDGNIFFENATSQFLKDLKTSEYMLRLQNLVIDLRVRAKGAAIDKTGSTQYINAQVEMYEIKFRQCIATDNSTEIEDLLQNEADEYGVDLDTFKGYVILRYNDAKLKYELFMRMIERCRTKIQTLIENTNWSATDTAFSIVSKLQNADQAQAVMNEILSL